MGLGLGSFNNFIGLWRVGTVPCCLCCLVSGSGMIRARGVCFLGYKRDGVVLLGAGSGLVGLRTKGMLSGESFAISRK